MIDLDFLSNDYQDNRPEAQKVAESIAIDILTGVLRPGQRISERTLCDKYALGRPRQAYMPLFYHKALSTLLVRNQKPQSVTLNIHTSA